MAAQRPAALSETAAGHTPDLLARISSLEERLAASEEARAALSEENAALRDALKN